ncbi:MAG: exo-alpha-sialidase [Bacteroidales bacterium]
MKKQTSTLICGSLMLVNAFAVSAQMPFKPSTKKSQYWYQVVSTATNDYCKGKTIILNGDELKFDETIIDPTNLWCFESITDSTFTMMNYASKRYIANSAKDGLSDVGTPILIKKLADNGQYSLTPIGNYPLHAQQSGSLLTNYPGVENSASAWRFNPISKKEMKQPKSIVVTNARRGTHVTQAGEKRLPLFGFDIQLKGFKNKEVLEALTFDFGDCSDPNVVENIRLYSSSSFGRGVGENSIELGTIDIKDEKATLKLESPITLSLGSNFFWLVADVSDKAKEGDQLDVTLNYIVTKNNKQLVNLKESNPINVFLTKSTLFSPGDYGSKYYRIPVIETANDGSLVSVTDRRPFHSGDLPQAIDLYVRRSTDNGQTWSEPLMIAGEGDDKNGFGDAAIVKTNSGRLIVLFVGYKGLWDSTHDNPQRQFMVTSDDNGVTWTKPREITNYFYGPSSEVQQTKDWDAFFITSGRGLCTEDNHVLFAIPTRVRGRKGLSTYTIGSSDEGETWRVMDLNKPATRVGDESKITQLNDGRLLMSIRRHNKRDVVYGNLENGEIKWQDPIRHEDLTDPFCNGEIMVYTSTKRGDDKNRMIHSLCDAKNRSNVSVLLSYDEGKTFPIKRTICPTASAYSTLCILPDGTIGCYYEDGPEKMNLVFVRFSLDWLTRGADSFNPNR